MSTYTTQTTTIDLLAGYLPRYGWHAFQVMEDTPAGGKILTGWHSQFVDQSRVMFISLDSRHTGQPEDVIRRDTDRDFFLSAPEAQKYGLIDHVIHSRKGERD